MKQADRGKAARLEHILEQFDRWYARTLADLADAGYDYETVAEAKHRLAYQRKFPSLGQAELDSVMYQAKRKEERAARRAA